MSSIIMRGRTFHGISVFGRGAFTFSRVGIAVAYAGQHKDGCACGLGVATHSDGDKEYADHGPDGDCDGRYLRRWADGLTVYNLCKRGKMKDEAAVSACGHFCTYNGERCARDDPRLLALMAQVAPVEVSPAAAAHHLPPSNRPMDRSARFALAGACDRHGHRGASPRRMPSLVNMGTQPNNSRTAPRDPFPPGASCRALQFRHPVSVLAGRGSRGQPATAIGGACELRPPSLTGDRLALKRQLNGATLE
jgi:hypothetical protein